MNQPTSEQLQRTQKYLKERPGICACGHSLLAHGRTGCEGVFVAAFDGDAGACYCHVTNNPDEARRLERIRNGVAS